MHDDDVPAEALALVGRIARAVRDELGAEIDAYPGASSPERADPLNRAFRAIVHSLLEAGDTTGGSLPTLVSGTLRRASEHRLSTDGWDDRRVGFLLDLEPGGPDDWLAYLLLSSRAQIEPLPTHHDQGQV